MDFVQSATFKNLGNAFAGESQARNRYSFFASQANNDGLKHIQAIFEETADNEKAHAKTFFKLMVKYGGESADRIHVDADYPLILKDTLANLQAAAAGEHEEWAELYNRFGEVAAQEGYPEIATVFHNVASVEKNHEERFTRLAKELETGTAFRKGSPIRWKCRNCGFIYEGSSAPERCPACDHPQGFFEEFVVNY